MPPFIVLRRLLQRKIGQEKFKSIQSNFYADNRIDSFSKENKEIKQENLSRQDACRICLKEGSVPIFNGTQTIVDEIRDFGCVEINEDDDFPKLICDSCQSLLQTAQLFRKTAQESDCILRSKNDILQENENIEIGSNYENRISDIGSSSENEDNPNQFNLFYCKKCNMNFNNHIEYFEHRKSEDHKKSRVQCPICKVTVSSFYLNVHIIRIHTMERPYVCEICGKSFPVQGSFKKHAMTHTNELAYKCEQCPYRGRFPESLRLHARVHSGEKPYACAQCPARFLNKSNLNKHCRSHRTHFEFKCAECNRGFHTNRELKEHLKVQHSGLREHVCNICGKEFGYRKAMMKHQRKVHHTEKRQTGRVPLYLQLMARPGDGNTDIAV